LQRGGVNAGRCVGDRDLLFHGAHGERQVQVDALANGERDAGARERGEAVARNGNGVCANRYRRRGERAVRGRDEMAFGAGFLIANEYRRVIDSGVAGSTTSPTMVPPTNWA